VEILAESPPGKLMVTGGNFGGTSPWETYVHRSKFWQNLPLKMDVLKPKFWQNLPLKMDVQKLKFGRASPWELQVSETERLELQLLLVAGQQIEGVSVTKLCCY
jgi:hypothetical protein